ncbi:ubiquitin-like-conjugating enzyme ATG10 isoform X1 [Lepisosteus oculatus]|uniref:ubiquitin-like-conjugating enzyme ATG10 isoform X1 n=1 Tax=Lepisosteus oculatus TaxID=7918 RepID=UPI003721A871
MSGELEKARDLYLEEAAFRLFCKQLVLHSQALGDGWVWEDMKESEDGYMKKTLLKAGPVSAPSRDCGQRSPRDEPAELELEAQTPVEEEPGEGDTENAIVKTTEVIRYEYHVVYSCSYRVPVLYFRASTLEGRPLGLEEIWAGVHEHYRERLLQGPWDTITQQKSSSPETQIFLGLKGMSYTSRLKKLDLSRLEERRYDVTRPSCPFPFLPIPSLSWLARSGFFKILKALLQNEQ